VSKQGKLEGSLKKNEKKIGWKLAYFCNKSLSSIKKYIINRHFPGIGMKAK
jgi:hypothetical protein